MSHNGLFPHPMAFDMALQPVAFHMLRRGIRIDLEKREEIRQSHIDEWKQLQTKLDMVTGGLNVNSSKQLLSFIKSNGIKARTKDKKETADEDALRAILAESEGKLRSKDLSTTKRDRYFRVYVALTLVIKIKALRTELSRYLEMDIDDDARARCTITVGGTETGRFSHSGTPWGTGGNLATIPRKLRAFFVPDDGWELAEFDLNRGESWVYSYISGDPELIRIHSTNGDFHSETASAISSAFGDRYYTIQEIIDLYKAGDNFGYKIRFLGKKVNHASAYRMGPFRGAEVVNSEADDTGITVTVSQFGKAQKLWQQKYCMMPHWWLDIEKQIKKDRRLETPYGRERTFYGFISDHLMKEATAYVPQSTSVDYLNLGMLKLYNELVRTGFCDLLHQQHDSVLVHYPIERREEVLPEVKRCLSDPKHAIRIGKDTISIPVEGSYGQNWLDLKGWKE